MVNPNLLPLKCIQLYCFLKEQTFKCRDVILSDLKKKAVLKALAYVYLIILTAIKYLKGKKGKSLKYLEMYSNAMGSLKTWSIY